MVEGLERLLFLGGLAGGGGGGGGGGEAGGAAVGALGRVACGASRWPVRPSPTRVSMTAGSHRVRTYGGGGGGVGGGGGRVDGHSGLRFGVTDARAVAAGWRWRMVVAGGDLSRGAAGGVVHPALPTLREPFPLCTGGMAAASALPPIVISWSASTRAGGGLGDRVGYLCLAGGVFPPPPHPPPPFLLLCPYPCFFSLAPWAPPVGTLLCMYIRAGKYHLRLYCMINNR